MFYKFFEWLGFKPKVSSQSSSEESFLLSANRLERKMDAEFSAAENEPGFKLIDVDWREEIGGLCHQEMFLKWDDGSLTVVEPDQWNLKTVFVLKEWEEQGKRLKKIGRELGPPLTQQEFKSDYQNMFDEPAPKELLEVLFSNTNIDNKP